jgi:hypothetical protein
VHEGEEAVDHVHELGVRRDRETGDDRRQVNGENEAERRRVPAYQREQPGHGEQQQPGEQRVPAPGQRRVLAWRAVSGAGNRTGRGAAQPEQPGAAEDHARPADDAEQHRGRQHGVRWRDAGEVLADRRGHRGAGAACESPRDQAVQAASRGRRLVRGIGAVGAAAAQVAQAGGLAQRGKQRTGAGQAAPAGGPPVPRGRARHHQDAPHGGQPDRDEQRRVGDHPVR